MSDRVRIAVVGAGAMGANHARVLAELPEAELVAVCDVDEVRLREVPREPATRLYGDLAKLLTEEHPEGVTIAVPTRRHADAALACIDRGVPLLVEKPLAAAVEEAEELQSAAAAAGVPLMVGYVERFNPAVQELKRRIDAGDLGRVIEASARRVGPFFPRERDVGVALDLATHDIDVLRWLLGREVEQVQAETRRGIRTQHEDALAGVLRFEGGVVASLEANWLSPIKVRELTLLGERGMFVVDYLRQELRWHAGTASEPSREDEAQLTALPGAGEAPLRAELSAFLRVARREMPPPVSAADGIAALRVADALVAAAERGAPVGVGAGG
jgi:predicted dehydrogenase